MSRRRNIVKTESGNEDPSSENACRSAFCRFASPDFNSEPNLHFIVSSHRNLLSCCMHKCTVALNSLLFDNPMPAHISLRTVLPAEVVKVRDAALITTFQGQSSYPDMT